MQAIETLSSQLRNAKRSRLQTPFFLRVTRPTVE